MSRIFVPKKHKQQEDGENYRMRNIIVVLLKYKITVMKSRRMKQTLHGAGTTYKTVI
jgi:hypothetical protein